MAPEQGATSDDSPPEMRGRDTVICLHSSASSGGQWRRLAEALTPRWRVLTPDLYGYGKQADAVPLAGFHPAKELTCLAPVFAEAGERFHLVGHSYGGLIAMLAALANPERVRSLVVYEPAAWSIALHANPEHPGAREMIGLRDRFLGFVETGQLEAAAALFVDFWGGSGVWSAMSPERQAVTARGMRKVYAEFVGERVDYVAERTTLRTLATLTLPVLYLTGTATRDIVRQVTERLAPALARVERRDIPGAGHMGPVTHADAVNREIAGFLAAQLPPADKLKERKPLP